MKFVQTLLDRALASVREQCLSQPPAKGKRLATLGLAPMITPDRRQIRKRCLCW